LKCDLGRKNMLKAEILKALYELKKPSGLAEIAKKLPWENIEPETVRRYLIDFVKHDLVMMMEVNGVPTYQLTAHGVYMVTFVIKHLEEFGRVRWEEIANNAYLSELVNLALELGIIEIKHGLLSIVTKGCGDVPTSYLITGVITPENQFVPIDLTEPPPSINSPTYGILVHVGGGVYVPKFMVRKSLWNYLPLIILSVLGLAAIAFTMWGKRK
jgi:Fe2+ or Zn2+ uptake regulation protein